MITCENRRVVEQFLKIGGRRIYQNLQGKWVWRTVDGFTAKGLVRIRAKGGRVYEVCPCEIPPGAFPGVA